MVELPPELWLYLAEFIPDSELRNLLDVSRIFYEIALNVRYKEIAIEGIDSRTVALDPEVAKRVLHLSIVSHGTRRQLIHDVQKFRFADFGRRKNLSVERATQLLIDVLTGFTNLNEFSIDFWGLPSSYKLVPFLNAAWSTFGKQIRTLFLSGHLDALRIIVETSTPMESLESLRIQLTASIYPLTDAGNSIESVLALRKFINGLSPRLKTLRLWSWASTDVSMLFVGLDHFPLLHRFHIRTAFNKAFPSDPSGLSRFVQSHASTLYDLQLWLHPAGSSVDPSMDQPLSEWLLATVDPIPEFPVLKDLQFYPTHLRGGFDAFLLTIQRSTNTLINLISRDHYLSSQETIRLIDALAYNGPNKTLISLRLNMIVFTGDVIDAMAEKLPGLVSLRLYIGDNQESFEDIMNNRSLTSWGLYDVGIWCGGSVFDGESMRLLARCIPSVRSFWGNGHMKTDNTP
ncbi:uncharacterized protein BT62DRAFT_1000467 [Guyanagaster necrorhizus]|uniref:F-box domain-containing protein n=1 Tax=Guyanagaster necrorhizus TaxID=856835 RepID=A0A9P8AXB6_9AGAR|nr:uncharacterized protein BT62DRAFT_1000467 [Guyanagaster necrorhizus MCA 3950]KAG7451220.1 hypothetical protein BT62DRAFT_1000467 [Guyanagaster necrorhizus MCA 3950]